MRKVKSETGRMSGHSKKAALRKQLDSAYKLVKKTELENEYLKKGAKSTKRRLNRNKSAGVVGKEATGRGQPTMIRKLAT